MAEIPQVYYFVVPYSNGSGTGAISFSTSGQVRLTHYTGTKGTIYTSGCFPL